MAPRIIHRFRPSVVMGTGMAIASIGAVLLLGVGVDSGSGLALIVAASIVMSLALAPVITLATELIVGSAPPEQAGAATGISETSGELGGALGIAILGSLGTAIYRSEVATSLPGGVPADIVDAARDTLGGALAIAQTLPEALSATVIAAAQSAFVDAIHVVAAVSAVGGVLTAIAAAAALRTVPARSGPPAAETAIQEPIGAAD
jgi:DHA2 family multidrug resistance protein-like MFS transporter